MLFLKLGENIIQSVARRITDDRVSLPRQHPSIESVPTRPQEAQPVEGRRNWEIRCNPRNEPNFSTRWRHELAVPSAQIREHTASSHLFSAVSRPMLRPQNLKRAEAVLY